MIIYSREHVLSLIALSLIVRMKWIFCRHPAFASVGLDIGNRGLRIIVTVSKTRQEYGISGANGHLVSTLSSW